MTDKSAKRDVEETERSAEERIAEAESRAQENLDMARRIQADFDNYRKRSQKDNEEFRKYASESLISDMLVILDDLERALSHAPKDNDLTAGVSAIKGNMMKILSSKGLSEISTEGRFDPGIHEALCAEPGDDDGNITEVFQKGYRIGDRIL
ncbi:MAG: nucleotide exchange factor GrpE, partial [Methanomassiliicoccaceae archaeon]|nr:nucleotide exchange factor GrpE [Methanomassiliicoccaceae archaeon]